MPAFLADTSVWIWAGRSGALQERLAERAEAGELRTCVPVALELLHGARDADEYERQLARLTQLEWLPLSASAGERALATQRALAATTHGAHRIPAVDYLIAALAQAEQETVLWHADRDLRRICDLTGQPHEEERPRR